MFIVYLLLVNLYVFAYGTTNLLCGNLRVSIFFANFASDKEYLCYFVVLRYEDCT